MCAICKVCSEMEDDAKADMYITVWLDMKIEPCWTCDLLRFEPISPKDEFKYCASFLGPSVRIVWLDIDLEIPATPWVRVRRSEIYFALNCLFCHFKSSGSTMKFWSGCNKNRHVEIPIFSMKDKSVQTRPKVQRTGQKGLQNESRSADQNQKSWLAKELLKWSLVNCGGPQWKYF